jgi:tRNA(Ile)-lysidine synthase
VDGIDAVITDRRLIDSGQGVLVGVSGGPDSVALFHALTVLAPDYGWDVWAGHLNHGLRGEEADADARYVHALASSLNRGWIEEAVNVADTARLGPYSLEQAGRHARYAFFQRAAQERGLQRVALGHTLDDQAETVLLRLLRGAGVEGLAGIPWQRPLAPDSAIQVIRPLLGITREEILEYCRESDLKPRTDTTNEELAFWRNRVRHLLLPLLEREFMPNVRQLLGRTAAICREETPLLNRDTDAAFSTALLEQTADLVVLDRSILVEQPLGRCRRLLRRALMAIGLYPEYGHLESLTDLIFTAAEGAEVHLPGGVVATLGAGGRVLLARGKPLETPRSWRGVSTLVVPGDTLVPDLEAVLRSSWLNGEDARRIVSRDLPRQVAVVDASALEYPLQIRTRRDGDRFRPLGMTGTRKLKDFLMSARVPRAERDRVPLVISAGQIVWVAGHRLDDRFRVTARTNLALQLEFCRLAPPDSTA